MVSRLAREDQPRHFLCFDGMTLKILSISMTCVGDQHIFRKRDSTQKSRILEAPKFLSKNIRNRFDHTGSVWLHIRNSVQQRKKKFREFGSKASKSVCASNICKGLSIETDFSFKKTEEILFSYNSTRRHFLKTSSKNQ